MINGAMQVFAEEGYDHASTDDMVKVASVSKGLWFHYFGSKQGLYLFVLDYSLKYIKMELDIGMDGGETDYFAIRRNIEHVRISIMRSYPYLYLFLKTMMNENSDEVKEVIAPYRETYFNMMEQCLSKADWSEVDPRILRSKVDVIVEATIEDIYRRAFKTSIFSMDSLEEELVEYLNMIEIMTKKL